jgi:hypothetical protein
MKKLFSALFVFVICQFAQAQITETMKLIDSTTPFKPITGAITRGSLIKTSNFHYYEINDKVNQKFNNAQPRLMVYQDGKKFKIKIEGIEKLLTCNKVQEVIESNIDGDFKGWDGTTSFKLVNQQIWKQDNPTSTVFANMYRPAVLVYLSSEGYKLKIEGLNEDPILVKKVQ